MMKVSATDGGIGSEATSGVPILENTLSTSANCTSRFSICFCISMDWVRLVPGMRMACIATSPSSRFGTNSLPSRVASRPHPTTSTSAPATIQRPRRRAKPSIGS